MAATGSVIDAKTVTDLLKASQIVVNLGSDEDPNYAGSAYAVGRARGIRDALAAVKNCKPKAGYEYDDCVAAIEALLAEVVR